MAAIVLQRAPEEPSTVVIVVGSGLAGLSAAYEALKSGATRVCLLDSDLKPGGNSIKASSGINGAPTQFQKTQDDDKFFDDTVRSAGKRMESTVVRRAQREELISTLTNSSKGAIEFLSALGVDLNVVTQLGGHSVARTHRGHGGAPGAAIIRALLNKLKEDFGPGKFDLLSGCTVTKLLTSVAPWPVPTIAQRTRVIGVEYKEADSGRLVSMEGPVIFATGGFAGDAHGLLAQYRPDLAGLPSTNSPRPGMHGQLSDVGAQLVDMDSVQIHPTGFVDPANPLAMCKILAAELLRGEGGILLREGQRFVDELATREKISNIIMSSDPTPNSDVSGLKQWNVQLVLDAGAAAAAAKHLEFYVGRGLMRKTKFRDLDPTTKSTLKEYSKAVIQGQDPLGRTYFGHWELGQDGEWDDEAEVVIGSVTPVTHFTMGGVMIDKSARVLAKGGNAIPGLWAAGEITGGLHGDNRLGGSSLLECVVFGRIAGHEAAKALFAHSPKAL
ncbi:fumarate reductase 2 [Echria macrotheca]|uniref:Fumarate reductase n=1 Tax=Echria macrotheca TaxID=438768 RepID=A0AAJ0F9R9_9PEZI|nr:fumarate reductase 2 [Echria macrotheca]